MEKENLKEITQLLWRLKTVPLITFGSLYASQYFGLFEGEKMLPAYITAAAAYIIGKIFDSDQTNKAMITIHQAETQGIKTDLVETHPDLPNRFNEDEVYDFKYTLADYLVEVPCIVFPPLGVLAGISGIFAGLNNRSLRKKLESEMKSDSH